MIDNGQGKKQSGLAHKLGVSRVRICKIFSLLTLDSLIIQELERLGDPFKSKIITKRLLRPYVNNSLQKQNTFLNILKTLF